MTTENGAQILETFPARGEDQDEWIMAYRFCIADGWAPNDSSIADYLPLAKIAIAAIRQAVEREREECAKAVCGFCASGDRPDENGYHWFGPSRPDENFKCTALHIRSQSQPHTPDDTP